MIFELMLLYVVMIIWLSFPACHDLKGEENGCNHLHVVVYINLKGPHVMDGNWMHEPNK